MEGGTVSGALTQTHEWVKVVPCPADGRTTAKDEVEIPDANVGHSAPLGATVTPNGVNFSLYSRHATNVELLLFERADDILPAESIRFDPAFNRTYHYWHVAVPGLRPGQPKAI
jgi:isoamylase